MKIFLIRPPLTITNPYQLENMPVGLPLGVLYVAAMLEKENQVEIFDGLVNFDLAANEKAFQDKIRRRHYRPIHFGSGWEEIKNYIAEKRPDIVGITNHFTEEVDMALKIASLTKEVDRKIVTIMGGPYASTCPAELLGRGPNLDMVIMGEGEYTLPQVVKALENKKDLGTIEGVAYRSKQKIIVNKRRPYIRELDALPLPAYHLVDMGRYFYFQRAGYSTRRQVVKSRKIPIITSRGCPFNCIFCCIHLHMGKVWRAHSSGYILQHLDSLVRTFKAEHILFEDDNINADPSRFEEILDGLKARDYKIYWDTPNGIRADKLNERLIRKARETGCRFLKIGIESGDQGVVNRIVKKHLDLNKVIEVARLCKKIGIELQAFFIIGFPGETRREIRNTVNFSLMLFSRYNVVSAIGPAKPLIGTKLREICKEKKYLTGPLETEEMKKRLMARQEMIVTEEFDLDYLFRVIKRYEFRRRLMTVEKIILFILRRPDLLLSSVGTLIREIIYQPGEIKKHLKVAFDNLKHRNV